MKYSAESARTHFQEARRLARNEAERRLLENRIEECTLNVFARSCANPALPGPAAQVAGDGGDEGT